MKIPSQSVRQVIGTIGWSPSSCQRALARLLVVGLLLGSLTGSGQSSTLSGPNSGPTKETSKGAPAPSGAPKRKTAQDAVLPGQLVAVGTVYLNEVVVLSGATVFSNTLVRVSGEAGSQAIINLGALGILELAAGAQMVLRFSSGLISGELLTGDALVRAPAGVRVSISTPDGLVQSSGVEPTELPVRTSSGVRLYEVQGRTTINPAATSIPATTPPTFQLAALMLGITGVVAVTAIAATRPVVSPFTP
ncbi:MAG: hypothetical protein ACOYNR_10995 [Blastocatellia bacterium]|jgi:hypothetical protein